MKDGARRRPGQGRDADRRRRHRAQADPRHRQRHGARPRHGQLRQERPVGAGRRRPADGPDRRPDRRRQRRLSRRRRARPSRRVPALARLWHEAGGTTPTTASSPPALVALRTLRELPATACADFGDPLRVAGPPGEPLGLCVVSGDEIDQLFVAPAARGTGLAATAAGRRRGAARRRRRAPSARIACAIGNDRALALLREARLARRPARRSTHRGLVRRSSVTRLRKRPGHQTEDAPMRHSSTPCPSARSSPASTAASSTPSGMTFAWWRIDAGAAVPEHAHPHEQVVNVLEGELVADRRRRGACSSVPATSWPSPAACRHAARALGRCRVLDVFSPVREDYRPDVDCPASTRIARSSAPVEPRRLRRRRVDRR